MARGSDTELDCELVTADRKQAQVTDCRVRLLR
jgi:predicted nucleic acid-binding protein